MEPIMYVKKQYEVGDWRVLVTMLKVYAKEQGITQQEISDKTGLIRSNVSRLFSLRYKPNLDVFLRIAAALGIEFYLDDILGRMDMDKLYGKCYNEIYSKKK